MSLKISTTLEEWLRIGQFGPLKIGDHVEDVIRLLGETPHYGPKSRTSFPSYWLYDEIEFGFDEAKRITWIQSDTCRLESARSEPEFIDFDWQGVTHNMQITDCQRWLDDRKLVHELRVDDAAAVITIEQKTNILFGEDLLLVTVSCPVRHPSWLT